MSGLIKKPHELKEVATIKALLYGPPGIGKTTLGLSAPRPLCIACDDGIHRIAPQHQTDTIEVGEWKDCTAVLDVDLSEYDTLVIDTAGKMLMFMNEYVGKLNNRNKQSDGSLTQKGFGVRKQLFLEFLHRISQLGKHVVFIAHDKEDKKGDILYVRPDVGGSSGQDLVRELDLVGYIEPIGSMRTISFEPTEGHYGKNTIGLPPVIELPGIDKPNTFLTGVFTRFAQSVKERRNMGQEFQRVTSEFNAVAEKVKDAATANEAYKFVDEYKGHIWNSMLVGKTAIFNKAKEIGLIANPATKMFEPAPKPPAEKKEEKKNGKQADPPDPKKDNEKAGIV